MCEQGVDKWKWLLPDVLGIWPDFLTAEEASVLQLAIVRDIAWAEHEIVIFGKRHVSPRLTAFVADAGVAYSYSGISMIGEGWPSVLVPLRDRVSIAVGATFNSVLLNLYRDGNDSMGYHADDEPELGTHPVIASVSMGSVRRFRMKPRTGGGGASGPSVGGVACDLPHGSLLVMKGDSQQGYRHAIMKTKKPVAPRLNLTFRTVYRPGRCMDRAGEWVGSGQVRTFVYLSMSSKTVPVPRTTAVSGSSAT